MNYKYLLAGIAVMAITTYLIRMLPMVIFQKKISNKWIQSFLFYVPYTVLAAMTFPAILNSTGSKESAIAGCIVAIILAYFKRGLLTVAVGSSVAVLIMQLLESRIILNEIIVLRQFKLIQQLDNKILNGRIKDKETEKTSELLKPILSYILPNIAVNIAAKIIAGAIIST